jgi:hypothetical protein
MDLPKFNALIADTDEAQPPTEHEVTIMHGDQLRAELEAPKHGLNDMQAAPMHFTTLWIWAALLRTHVITDDFRTFKGRLLAIEAVDDDEPVDPTQLEDATS